MVCGSIGYGNAEAVRSLYARLGRGRFKVLNHIESGEMDYSNISDFRGKESLCKKIVKYDLECLKDADVIVAVANGPSYGTAMEILMAKQAGKITVLLAKNPIRSPWPIHFSDHVVSSESELVELLRRIDKEEE